MIKECIKMFNGVLIPEGKLDSKEKDAQYYAEVYAKTVPLGFVIEKTILDSMTKTHIAQIISIMKKELKLTGAQMNSSFHKSWDKVQNASMEQLVLEQILHYITVYGFKEMGFFSHDTVFIPAEELSIPEIDGEAISLTVIHGYSQEVLKEKVMDLLESGVALKEETLDDLFTIALEVEIDADDIYRIKNKEMRIRFYETLDIVPSNPEEWLRYVVYKVTGSSLLIKDKGTIEKLKEANVSEYTTGFADVYGVSGMKKLSSIFLRYKPLFLAMKGKDTSNFINKLRRYAVKNHKPMKVDYLNTFTSNENWKMSDLKEALNKVNTFRKVRLLQSLLYRMSEPESIVYRVRNGKAWATKFDGNVDGFRRAVAVIRESIAVDLAKKIDGKTILMTEAMNYATPATEKQFVGNLPAGSYIEVDEDLVFGVHWENGNSSIDIDLSLLNGRDKIGWNGAYRDANVLFSGDVTNAPAPNGASELFYIKKNHESEYLMKSNIYSGPDTVPMKIVVAKSKIKNLKKNHMLDPNEVICMIPYTQDERGKVLGLVRTKENGCRFYFHEMKMGAERVSRNSEANNHARNYMLDSGQVMVSFEELLELAGAKIIYEKEVIDEKIVEPDFDLSVENLSKDSILSLLY